MHAKWGLKYRPLTLDQLLGQADSKDLIRGALKLPNKPDAWLLSGSYGCIAADTLIEGVPIGDRSNPGPVQTLFGPEMATAGYLKGRADLYKVRIGSGSEVVVTEDHRMLTPSGWLPLRSIQRGSLVAIDGTENGETVTGRRSGCLVDCYAGFHQDGELPTPAQVAALSRWQPLHKIGDGRSASGCISSHACTGGSSDHSSLFYGVLSLLGGVFSGLNCPGLHKLYQFRSLSLLRCIERLFQALETDTAAFLPLGLHESHSSGVSYLQLFERIRDDGQFRLDCGVHATDESLRLGPCVSAISRHLHEFHSSVVPSPQLPERIRDDGRLRFDYGVHATDESLRPDLGEFSISRNLPLFPSEHPLDLGSKYKDSWGVVQDISFVKHGDFYDLTVPGAGHYSAHGLWHHNSGKTTTARILSKALICLHPLLDGQSCNRCSECLAIDQIETGQNLSMNYYEMDAPSLGNVKNIRELLEDARLAPVGGSPYRVYLIDESHSLTRDAQGVLLKALEDGIARTVFILATTDPEKLLPTIKSRCIVVGILPADRAEVIRHLREVVRLEGVEAEDAALDLIAEYHYGHLRNVLNMAYQVSLAGPITLDVVRRQLNLHLDDDAALMVFQAGESWDQLVRSVERVTRENTVEDVWGAVRRSLAGAYLAVVHPTRGVSEPVRRLSDRYGARLGDLAEWAMGDGARLQVRVGTDLLVGLARIREKLGVGTNGAAPVRRMGMSKADRMAQGILRPSPPMTAERLVEMFDLIAAPGRGDPPEDR